MKKLILATLVAGSLFTLSADEAAASVKAAKPAATAVKAQPTPFHNLTPDQRAKFMAEKKKFMAERRAEMEARGVAIIKKYGLDDAKAKELFAELEKMFRSQRRPRPMPKARAAKPAAEKKD